MTVNIEVMKNSEWSQSDAVCSNEYHSDDSGNRAGVFTQLLFLYLL